MTITLDEIKQKLTDANKNMTNISIQEPTPSGPADRDGNPTFQASDLEPAKNSYSTQSANVLAPILQEIIQRMAEQIATDIANQQIAPLIQRIQILETRLGISS